MATVLIADDNRANRHAPAALLESVATRPGRRRRPRSAGESARRAPGAGDLDVLMPLMDGTSRAAAADDAATLERRAFYTAYFGSRRPACCPGARRRPRPGQARRERLILRAVEDLLA
jgi:hypothetical protein